MASYINKIFLYCVVLVVFASSVTACRSAKSVSHAAGVHLNISDSIIATGRTDTFNLGRLKQGETVMKEFALHNSGDKPFLLNNVKSDCGCVVSQYDSRPIQPGEFSPVSISFDSRGYHGLVFKRVEIFTSINPKPLTVWLHAVVE